MSTLLLTDMMTNALRGLTKYKVYKVQSVQAQGLQTLPQAKRHQPSLLFTSLAILTSLTFITR